ncbi:hypothetical protein HMPREF0542_10118 [Ligilactobacillus ruminis ATCC 25644]|uniref:Uncharacterized protein n=1 Tax=Ligilactobacillus ruminis ATCC 25644 TaxID=525362 RepID=E7FMJ1_9LACO|nr:hypothetical protein HMPREF0542_10118 [Ligilactobacillus ruminis ATCC 25644]
MTSGLFACEKAAFSKKACCSTNLSQDFTQIYGQRAIFIDVSVNGRAFVQCGV